MLVIVLSLGGNKTKRWAHNIPRWISKVGLFVFGVKMITKGKEKLDENQQYIFIANHNSNLDPLIMPSQLMHYFKLLGKAEVLSYPMFGYVLKHLYVSVWRQNQEDRNRSMEAMRSALDEGASLVIYPEGTRNRTEGLLSAFHDGAFKLAIASELPVMALVAINSNARMQTTNWWVKPGSMYCEWVGPFDSKAYKPEDLEAFKKLVWNAMHEVLARH